MRQVETRFQEKRRLAVPPDGRTQIPVEPPPKPGRCKNAITLADDHEDGVCSWSLVVRRSGLPPPSALISVQIVGAAGTCPVDEALAVRRPDGASVIPIEGQPSGRTANDVVHPHVGGSARPASDLYRDSLPIGRETRGHIRAGRHGSQRLRDACSVDPHQRTLANRTDAPSGVEQGPGGGHRELSRSGFVGAVGAFRPCMTPSISATGAPVTCRDWTSNGTAINVPVLM